MTTLLEMAQNIRILNPPTVVTTLEETKSVMDAHVCGPSIAEMFDNIFRPAALDPRKVTMESVLDAMKPAVAPRED